MDPARAGVPRPGRRRLPRCAGRRRRATLPRADGLRADRLRRRHRRRTAPPLYADAEASPASAAAWQRSWRRTTRSHHDDNPALTSIVLQALTRLQQIAAGLNFFGFAPDYLPPFSFEYLQTTTRYFAQQASQAEQRYIQFKSQAENEELQRDQMAQQADVARQSVVLEQRRGRRGAGRRGGRRARASTTRASSSTNAQQSKKDFDDNRWELLELTEAEAWAQASAVDHDDEVKLTWTSSVLQRVGQERATRCCRISPQRKARLSQDLEAEPAGPRDRLGAGLPGVAAGAARPGAGAGRRRAAAGRRRPAAAEATPRRTATSST